MTTYDVLVSNELLAKFTESATLPEGFRFIGPADGPSGYRSTRMRVEDDSAPETVAGKLVDVVFSVEYDENGSVTKTRITDYRILDEEAVRIAGAVQLAEDNPGHTIRVEDGE